MRSVKKKLLYSACATLLIFVSILAFVTIGKREPIDQSSEEVDVGSAGEAIVPDIAERQATLDTLEGDFLISQRTDPARRLEQARRGQIERIKIGLQSDDGFQWKSAFSELLEVHVRREEAIELAVGYLENNNLEKRLVASDILLRLNYFDKVRVGETLAGLLLIEPEAIVNVSIKNRISSKAFRLISQYRLRSVLPYIDDILVGHPDRYKLFKVLTALGERSIIPEIKERTEKRVFKNHIEYLGLLNAAEEADYVMELFESPESKEGMKIASAWAMMRFGAEEPYRSFLEESALRAIESNAYNLPDNYFEKKRALKYLASINNEDTKRFLEKSLESANHEIVDIALANLILRYDSDIAVQKLINALGDRRSGVDMQLKYRLSTIVGSSELNEIHPVPGRGSTNTIEWRYRVHQKDWSIYNWVHDYTIDY